MKLLTSLLCFLSSITYGQTLTVKDVIEVSSIKTKLMPPIVDYLKAKGFEEVKGFRVNGGFEFYVYTKDGVLHTGDSIKKTMTNAIKFYSDENDLLIPAYVSDKVEVKDAWIKELQDLKFRAFANNEYPETNECRTHFAKGNLIAIVTIEETRWGRRYELAVVDK